MANGSFGLSGLPSAPTVTTVATGAVTPVSAITTTVSSTAGFSAGDLIYLKNGDYGVPPNATGSTGGIAVYDTQSPVLSGTVGSNMRWPTYVYGANRGGTSSAKLSNGNTVFVYYFYNAFPYFTIVDPNGSLVVGQTLISSSIYASGTMMLMSVVALTGGGFAVVYNDNQSGTNRMAYAIYTNGGGVTTSPTRDTTITTASSLNRIATVALPNGGFAVAVRNSANFTQTRFFTSTAATGSWTTPSGMGATSGSDLSLALVARANSNIALVIQDATGSVVFNISSSNASLGNGRLTVGTTSWAGQAAVLLADDSIAVFASNGSGLYYYNVTGTTTASWSTVKTATSTSFVFTSPVAYLTSSNKIVVYSYGQEYPQYEFFDTAGNSLMGCPAVIPGGVLNTVSYSYPSFIENGSNVNIYWTPVNNVSTSYQAFMTQVTVNSSTYALQSFLSTDGGLLGTTAAVPIGAYNRTNSNPNGASYFAATSGTATANSVALGTAIKGQTVIESSACNAMSIASLPNGGCVILYKLTSNTIKFSAIDKAGNLQATVTVATGISNPYTARIAVLSNGKICVMYYNSATAGTGILSFAIYSSTYGLLTTGVLNTEGYGVESPSTDGSRIACLAALDNGDFVVFFAVDASGGRFRVYNDTGTATGVSYGVAASATTDRNFAVGGDQAGNIFISWKGSTTIWQLQGWQKLGVGNYVSLSTPSITGTNAQVWNRTVPVYPDGAVLAAYSNSTNVELRKVNPLSGEFLVNVGSVGATSGGNQYACCITGAGLALAFNLQAGNKPLYFYQKSGVNAATNPSWSVYTSDPLACMTGSYGNNAFAAFLNSSQYPTYTLVAGGPITYPAAYTTSSFTAPITLSPATGFYFTGVATSDCPPGGTGTVVVNGSAQLNSNYPSNTTYQAFDFRTPTLYGAKGTIGGRNVSLQGNT